MSAMEPLCLLLGINPRRIPKEMCMFLEAELFAQLCEALKEYFRTKHKEYFNLMKFTIRMEDEMLEDNLIQFVIDDILLTQEYDMRGIAKYSDTPEEIVCDVILGVNKNPSAKLFRRVINLHRSVRRELYKDMMRKIALDYLNNEKIKV